MLSAWLAFIAACITIAAAGVWLARFGDAIAEKTGLGGTWIGVILVATVTSLPELVTGVSSVALADAPNIAVGDALGSCVFNLALVAVLDFSYREAPLYLKASSGHILAAGFSVMMIGLVAFSVLAGDVAGIRLGHIGIYTPAIGVLYLVAVRSIFLQERRSGPPVSAERYAHLSLPQAAAGYAAAAAVIVAAGIALPFAAVRLAEVMGWGQSFIGTLFVAAATSLPEVAATLAALRIGAIDLAIGNLLGSNLFNILIIAIDDMAYLRGPLLAQVSDTHAVTAVSALIMTGAAVVGLHYRPKTRLFRIVGWISLALVLMYVFNGLVLYLREA
jgi:cation:H+ antiporter